MNHNFWIGGSSCSGKSSIAKKMAEMYDLELYSTDNTAFGKFMFELEEESKYPAIIQYRNSLFEGMDSFARRDVEISFKYFRNYCTEVFPLLMKDIRQKSKIQPLVIEGAHLFPCLLKAYASSENSLFLVSHKNHQRNIWLKEMSGEIPGGHPEEMKNFQQSENQKEIIQTRVQFHDRIAHHIALDAKELGFKCIQVHSGTTLSELQHEVVEHFSLS